MSHIFISYSRKDIDSAARLVQALAENNVDTWIDWKSIPKGEDWQEEIYRGIEAADAFLFLISPDSVASRMCLLEIECAVKNGKRILPIVLRDVKNKDVHAEIARRNWIFCVEGRNDFEQAVEETRKTIHTDYDWLKYHTELQLKALNWEQKKDNSGLLRGKELREADQQITSTTSLADPQPTELQRQFVLASREHEERQRRRTVLGLSLGLIVVTVVSILALIQRNIAVRETQAKSTAIVEKDHANATAVAEKNRADRQSEVALARQLAAQADLLINQEPRLLDRAVLLSIESLNHAHTYEGDEALRRGLSLLPQQILHERIQPASSSLSSDNNIFAMTFSPDGKWLAIGTSAEIISVWDTSTWTEYMHVEPERDDGVVRVVRALAFSPDGRYLVSGVDSGFAQVWDLASRKERSRFFHGDQVFSVAFSPDGSQVVSGAGKDVVLWNPSNGKEIRKFSSGSAYLIFSPDGSLLATADCREMNVWDVKTGSLVASREQFTDPESGLKCITAMVFSPDGTFIASADGESGTTSMYPRPQRIGGTILVWDAKTGADVSVMKHGDSVVALSFSENGSKLLSGSLDRTSRVWFARTGQLVNEFSYGPDITTAAFGHHGDQVIAAGVDGTARVWDAQTGEELNRLITDGDANILAIATHPTQPYIVAGNSAGEIWVWKLAGQEISNLDLGQYTSISSVFYTRDGKTLITGSNDKTARTWDVAGQSEIARVEHNDKVVVTVLSPDGKIAASGSIDGEAKIWDARTGSKLLQVPKLTSIADIKFSQEGHYLAVAEGLFPVSAEYLFNTLKGDQPSVSSYPR